MLSLLIFCALERIRTFDTQLRKLVLYPLSYEGSCSNLSRPRRDMFLQQETTIAEKTARVETSQPLKSLDPAPACLSSLD